MLSYFELFRTSKSYSAICLHLQPHGTIWSIINRPCVAGAVLQTPWSLIHSFIQSVILSFRIFKTPSHQNHKSYGPVILTQYSSPLCVRDTCDISCVTGHVSHVTSNFQTVRARELIFRRRFTSLHLSPVICYMSHVTCHMSCVT